MPSPYMHDSNASLPSLPPYEQSDANLTAHLASRYHAQQPISYLSSGAVISINTYNSSAKGPNGAKDGSALGAAEELASRAITRLGHRQENQAVVFMGESGSGKTTLRSHALSSLLSFSSTPLSKKLSYAAFVFDALTTTKTATTPTASKAGLFYELQYETGSSLQPALIGGKVLDHRLERSRVTYVPAGERNFHILYYLVAGTSPAERQHLGLDQSMDGQKRWRYLGHPSQLKIGVNDAEGFENFKTALRKLEFPREDIAHMCEILAAILHIGQLEFQVTQSTAPAADESGGYGQEGGEDVTTVKNKDDLAIIAAFLGVRERDLEQSMGYRTKTLHRERVTVMLDPKGAKENADELARTLYALLVALIMEKINQKICADEEAVSNTISIVDFPGFAIEPSTNSTLDQLLNNAACESLYNFCLQSFFERNADLLDTEDVKIPPTSYFDNSDAVRGLLKPGNGLLSILDDQMRRDKTDVQLLETFRRRFQGRNPAIEVVETAIETQFGNNFPTTNRNAGFTVRHFAGEVDYPVDGLIEANGEVISGDLMNLVSYSNSRFVQELFGQEALNKVTHPRDRTSVTHASVMSKPSRKPSVVRRNRDSRLTSVSVIEEEEDDTTQLRRRSTMRRARPKQDAQQQQQGASAQFLSSLETITQTLSAANTNPYFVFCLKPNDRRIANMFDSKCVRDQVQTLGIAEISQRLKNADYSVFMPFGEFLNIAEGDVSVMGSEKEKVEMIVEERRWTADQARVGSTGVFLSERCWRQITDLEDLGDHGRPSYDGAGGLSDRDLKTGFGEPTAALLPSVPYDDDKFPGYVGNRDQDAKSETGVSAFREGDMFRNLDTRSELAEKGNELKLDKVDERTVTGARKRWLFVVYFLTWWLPDVFIRIFLRIKRPDVRLAWREKLAINMIIWFSCLSVLFFMIGMPRLVCPTQNIISPAALTSKNGKDGEPAYASLRGIVFDLGKFSVGHYPTTIVPQTSLLNYAGTDVTNLFPVQVSAMCQGMTEDGISPAVQLNYQTYNYTGSVTAASLSDMNAQYHDFRWATNDSRPFWLTSQMLMLESNYYKGHLGYSPQYLKTLVDKDSMSIAYMYGRVYDFTQYVAGGRSPQYPAGYTPPKTTPDSNFMYPAIVELFQTNPGQDVTKLWEALPLTDFMRDSMQMCMDNLFYVGDLDTRGSVRCLFSKYILLGVSLMLVSVIAFKFFAALQFGRKTTPENLDKFFIATIPAYTEDEESLRRAIDSAARLRYDDKRKLLFIVCDGMIVGQGNDRPTPRIVLDILGVPETVEPDPLSFESLGEGMKQHNMAKVYSGLYEVQGHIVPYVVVVKVGKPSEVSRPGNRGKRDSQLLLMRFLNRVHYNLPMSPLELELHHQIRNVIGVNPTFYEFLLQIDADTVVAPDAATRMVAALLNDVRIIGVCGETALSNAKTSMITMMQVYEYYISHNLTKAFESLFGSVTCLPGCFSMFRIRAAETGKPLFVSREVVEDYAEIRVDTLHTKNLLHLGEDRYLTTLLLKHHPKYKTKYTMRAEAWTIAPESWSVFLSQRRRWINSTVHNLIELIPVKQLCGFCCFSMRFVVFLDLLSTLVQPVIIGYIAYLIYICISSPSTVPVTAFILLGAIYGLQAIIFILRRKWEMIGWMLIYILATPVFAFGLPLYAFWHMDEFSWGSTRVVTGEKGKQVVVSDEGKFDPATIPHKRWEEYQAELFDAQALMQGHFADDSKSEVSGVTYATKHFHAQDPSQFYQHRSGSALSQIGLQPSMHSPLGGGAYGYGNVSQMTLPPYQAEAGSIYHGQVSSSGFDLDEQFADALPSDDALLAEIRDILRTADLMSVTKKSIKAELERRFGVGLDAKRLYIGSATEAVLTGQL
ncbi:chitin synthase 5 [Neohortaea acidophila]|uniref:chitin synthase n=1 Tax=Neohortaea acidophila TaxID=245834 RepID=A0A6A6PI65_9PEZI|nr:chitin synthase 5 [Neohortaea acidophila]KAF2479615.1 chitin synthase 5 [Neohortaea acidophila]